MEDKIMDNDELLIVIKDLFENKTEEIKSYVDEKINGQIVLIERLQSDIKAVAEGHDILNRKMDSLDKKVDSLDKKVDFLDKKIDARTNELKSEIKIVENYIIGVDTKLNEHDVILKRVK
jgi:peptidoglycan hydrolase CwlO-like protein